MAEPFVVPSRYTHVFVRDRGAAMDIGEEPDPQADERVRQARDRERRARDLELMASDEIAVQAGAADRSDARNGERLHRRAAGHQHRLL